MKLIKFIQISVTRMGCRTRHEGERPRFKRPKMLVAIAWVYILATPINILLVAFNFDAGDVYGLLLHFSLTGWLLLLTAPIIGIGLLALRRVAYFSFLIHAACLVAYNLFLAMDLSGPYYAGSLVRSVLGLFALAYFLRREVSSPYLNLVPRGWRHHRREHIRTGIHIGDSRFVTSDLSSAGCFVPALSGSAPGDRVNLKLETDVGQIAGIGLATRVDSGGTGIQFVSFSHRHRLIISTMVRIRYPLRYALNLSVCLKQGGKEWNGQTSNISRRGFFVPMLNGERPQAGPIDFSIAIDSAEFGGTGAVVWVSEISQLGKDPGIGIRIARIENSWHFRQRLKKLSRNASTVR